MLWLPPIADDSTRRWLPLCDGSGVALLDAIIENCGAGVPPAPDAAGTAAPQMEELLVEDGALANWTAAQCEAAKLPASTLPELAVGLASHALDWLQGVRYTEKTSPPSDIQATSGEAASPLADERARLLPIVVKRFSRLNALEKRFSEEVEEARLSAMAEFAAGAGHEINNPLAVISGRAQLCMKNETNPQRRRDLSLISAQAMRIYEMIADMRLFARPPKPELVRVDIAAIIDRLAAEVVPLAEDQQTQFVTKTHGEPSAKLELFADPKQLHVALKAVCQNALDALGEGGKISVTVCRADRHIEIRIADNGPGILPEQRPHIFDPYYSARQAGRGLGMGLSKCWRIVRNHGGKIEMQNVPGGGAMFVICLRAN
jgi:signal transduction histidine kinase